MRLGLPPITTLSLDIVVRAFQRLEQVFSQVVTTQEAVPFVYLQSEDGSVYKVTVSNAGVLTTTLMPLGQGS